MKVIDPGLFEVIVGGNSGSASGQAGATGAPMKCVVNSTKDSMVTMCDAGSQIITMACQTSSAQVTVQIGNKVVGAKAGVNTTTPSCTMTVTDKKTGSSTSSTGNDPLRSFKQQIMLPNILMV